MADRAGSSQRFRPACQAGPVQQTGTFQQVGPVHLAGSAHQTRTSQHAEPTQQTGLNYQAESARQIVPGPPTLARPDGPYQPGSHRIIDLSFLPTQPLSDPGRPISGAQAGRPGAAVIVGTPTSRCGQEDGVQVQKGHPIQNPPKYLELARFGRPEEEGGHPPAVTDSGRLEQEQAACWRPQLQQQAATCRTREANEPLLGEEERWTGRPGEAAGSPETAGGHPLTWDSFPLPPITIQVQELHCCAISVMYM